ncbi:MAG: glycosyltransferase family 4 protein [Solirubrobacteraceae bacterium]
MRVGIDLTALLPEATGVDTYLLKLVEGLAAIDRRNRYVVFVNREDRERLPTLPDSFEVVRTAVRNRAVRLGWQQAGLPIIATVRGLDVIHSPSFIVPLAYRQARHVLTIHDLTSFSHPEWHVPLRRSWFYRSAVMASIRLAARICVPTQAVRDELVRSIFDPPTDRIRVIPHGVSSEFHPKAAIDAPAAQRRLRLPSSYILFVGTLEPRKNLELLLETYRRLTVAGAIHEDLVLAGRRGWDCEQVLALCRTPELRDYVHPLGYVDQTALPALYAGARVFVYPSLAEGFGLPPLEAMACGVPVAASSTPALAENFGGAAELVPADSAEALGQAVVRLARDDRLRDRRRREGLAKAKRFRWEQTARATLACYEELTGDDSRFAGNA